MHRGVFGTRIEIALVVDCEYLSSFRIRLRDEHKMSISRLYVEIFSS
jgi:hypothetical protein